MKKEFVVPTATKNAEITFGFATDSGDTSALIDWSPGNGTRYRVLFTPMTPELSKATGFDFGDRMNVFFVSWIIPGKACQSYAFVQDGARLHYNYVQEKLCFSRGSSVDASELTRIIGLYLNRPVELCTDENGRSAF